MISMGTKESVAHGACGGRVELRNARRMVHNNVFLFFFMSKLPCLRSLLDVPAPPEDLKKRGEKVKKKKA